MEEFKSFDTITLNGETLRGGEIVQYCGQSNSGILQEVGLFVKEWLSEQPYVLVQTSGSTGKPTQHRVLKDQMLASASLTAGYFNFKAKQTALLCLSPEYIAGKMMIVRSFFSSLNLICLEPSSHPLQDLADDVFIDFAPLVPMQLQKTDRVNQVRQILLGGAPLVAELEKWVFQLSAAVFHGYGMTETLSHIALRRVNGANATKVYTALPGVRLKLDARGCLIIQAPFLEAEVRTNDIVEMRGSDSFIWKGRYDYVVNSGGVKLFPEEIEEKISEYLNCRYFLSGVDDDVLGQKLCLFLESEPFDVAGLKKSFEEKLERFERPKEIYFVREFEETASGKVNRGVTIDKVFNRS